MLAGGPHWLARLCSCLFPVQRATPTVALVLYLKKQTCCVRASCFITGNTKTTCVFKDQDSLTRSLHCH